MGVRADSLILSTLAGAGGSAGSADGFGEAARFYWPTAIAADSQGDIYVADTVNCTIRKIKPDGEVITWAGLARRWGTNDGPGEIARFVRPRGVAVDVAGAVYVVDEANHTVRKITPDRMVTTFAGAPGIAGLVNGPGSVARFSVPRGIAVAPDGNIYVADQWNQVIRKITPSGEVSTFGSQLGAVEGITFDRQGNLYTTDWQNDRMFKLDPAGKSVVFPGLTVLDENGKRTSFYDPTGMACDAQGNIFFADTQSHTIRRISPDLKVTVFAGKLHEEGSADGVGSNARFSSPRGIAFDRDGNLLVTDCSNNTIRKITPDRMTTTVAGLSGGVQDGLGMAARFTKPLGVAVDSGGIVYVADTRNHTIRKITPDGNVTTYAGAATLWGAVDGPVSEARFKDPSGVAVDAAGNLFVADTSNVTIRKISPEGIVSTIAGQAGSSGFVDGPGPDARFWWPLAIAVDRAGFIYVNSSESIRKISPDYIVTTLAGKAGSSGNVDGPGASARFGLPQGIAVDDAGNVYVADSTNRSIRKIDPNGNVTTIAGQAGIGAVDGPVETAKFAYPTGIAFDRLGRLFVADGGGIRGIADGIVATVSGVPGRSGYADGPAHIAMLRSPFQIAIDTDGNVYVADSDNNVIRKGTPSPDPNPPFITESPASQWIISGSTAEFRSGASGSPPFTFQWQKNGVLLPFEMKATLVLTNVSVADAGDYTVIVTGGQTSVTSAPPASLTVDPPLAITTIAGEPGVSGDVDGLGRAARFNHPGGIAVEPDGNVYVADQDNHAIRRISPTGVCTTLAGKAGVSGSADGAGPDARFNRPSDLVIDASGNIYVSDSLNYTIRKITSGGDVSTIAGTPGRRGGQDGVGANALFHQPQCLAIDRTGAIFVSDVTGQTIRKIMPDMTVITVAGWYNTFGSTDGSGANARFRFPTGLAIDDAGNVFIADSGNHTIRKMTRDGKVSTFVGKVQENVYVDGSAITARLKSPNRLAIDREGYLYLTESGLQIVRKISHGGDVRTLVGLAGADGTSDGIGSAARFSGQLSIAMRDDGVFFITDWNKHTVRMAVPISAGPALEVSNSDDRISISWPTTLTDYRLELSDALGPRANWATVAENPVLDGSRFVVTQSLVRDVRFYRLRKTEAP